MGLKSDTVVGLGTLGIKEIIVELTSLRSFPEMKNDRIASVTEPWIIGHDFLKNRAMKPLGPGALSFLL